MKETRGNSVIEQSRIIPAPPLAAYRSIADPREHSAFTGARATGRARPGATFTAWDGYIRGRTLLADPGHRLVQEWATTEWPEGMVPSRLEWRFQPHARGTRVTLRQTGVPRSQVASYRQGWVDFYWRPLRAHWASRR
jgi:uncharacterized protein YndB with AHSA1/START domain